MMQMQRGCLPDAASAGAGAAAPKQASDELGKEPLQPSPSPSPSPSIRRISALSILATQAKQPFLHPRPSRSMSRENDARETRVGQVLQTSKEVQHWRLTLRQGRLLFRRACYPGLDKTAGTDFPCRLRKLMTGIISGGRHGGT